MKEFCKEYISLDGMLLKEEQLLKLAKNAGSIVVAEHYLCAYLAHAVMTGNSDAIVKLNEVRCCYGLPALAGPDQYGGCGLGRSSSAEHARRKYFRMSEMDRDELVCEVLTILIDKHRDLFKTKNYWNGIFLVLRDRIDEDMKKTDFAKWMIRILPQDWPAGLMISEQTMRNFSHYISYSDREVAYYDMDDNPWKELCNTFWSIMEDMILTNS
jgi:hypothetical protein